MSEIRTSCGRTLTLSPNSESFLDADELASRLGVSRRTVERLTVEGLPSEKWGLRTRRYLLSEALAWLREREGNT